MKSVITGIGCYIPEVVKTNREFMINEFYDENQQVIGQSPEVITRKFEQITVISERRYAGSDLNCSDLATMAAEKAIEDAGPSQLLPRYSRNRILNKGQESEFKREGGDVPGALSCSDEMLSMSVDYAKNPEFCAAERRETLKPIKSFALYYGCQAHLAVTNWNARLVLCTSDVFRTGGVLCIA